MDYRVQATGCGMDSESLLFIEVMQDEVMLCVYGLNTDDEVN